MVIRQQNRSLNYSMDVTENWDGRFDRQGSKCLNRQEVAKESDLCWYVTVLLEGQFCVVN